MKKKKKSKVGKMKVTRGKRRPTRLKKGKANIFDLEKERHRPRRKKKKKSPPG